MPRIAILGGGISGLSLAYFLKQALVDRAEIIILEASHRVGGWIASKRQDGVIFEQGPRSCRSNASFETLDLIKRLKLEGQLVFAKKEASRRFLFLDQKLIRLPGGPKDLIFSAIGRKLMTAAIKELSQKKSHTEETVYEFFHRRFSPFVADVFADALVSGIYAGDSRKLSLKACFPRIYALEQGYGSVLKGVFMSRFLEKKAHHRLRGLFSFTGGMETLVDALRDSLQGLIRYNFGVKEIVKTHKKIVVQGHEEEQVFDYVFSCLPASALAHIVSTQRYLSELLESISCTSIAVVNLAYDHDVIKDKGFGYLIPFVEKQDNLGVVWDSAVFSNVCPKGQTVLTVMIGGELHRNFHSYSDDDFIRIAMMSLSRQMGITTSPSIVSVTMAKHAIPQYAVGHLDLVDNIEKQARIFSPNLFVLGSSFFGVSVNDCIKKSQAVAQKFVKQYV